MSVFGCKITIVIKKARCQIAEGVVEMSNIKITWVSKGYLGKDRDAIILDLINKGYAVMGNATAELEFDFGTATDLEICERVFINTNRYEGKVWDALQPVMPEGRPHTSLSVGDKVAIDGREYVCSEIGFTLVA
jgi:hypothetical protein